jgi:signal transduction histidine kinase
VNRCDARAGSPGKFALALGMALVAAGAGLQLAYLAPSLSAVRVPPAILVVGASALVIGAVLLWTAVRELGDIVVAAERALLDSRWAIDHLVSPLGEPLDVVLARHAAVIATRTGVAVTFSTTGSADVGPEVSDALARILDEAVANSRHGGATRVHVQLSCSPLRMRVIDDGAGFDRAGAEGGFGLGRMHERAALVGARPSVRSGPGAGTEVAVELG